MIIEILEEQQLILKRSDELELHNKKLESVIMHSASRMRHMMEINERKDEAVEKLEEQLNNLQQQ